jgi:DNA-directed RNA polymerase specialized sigma54-like protein
MKRYGNRRIKAKIAEKGIELSRKTVAKLMKEQGLKPSNLSRLCQKPPIVLMEKESLKTCF